MLHLIKAASLKLFPMTKSIAVPLLCVVVPGGMSSVSENWAISWMRSSASWSSIVTVGGFQRGWWRLKSPAIVSKSCAVFSIVRFRIAIVVGVLPAAL